MREMIKKIVMELLPELAGGLHLDRYARVLAAGDAPTEGATSERFRPRYAVDLEILGPDMEPDKSFPRYSAVPLPVSVGGGQESGTFSFPEEGALVVVGFAYGRQDHPIIRQVFPLGTSLPALERGEVLMQQGPTSFQRVDAQGNWKRETTADIHENSLGRTVKAENYSADLGNENRSVAAHSTESVGSCKTIEAGTVLTLVAGVRADLGSLGALNLTAGGDSTHSTAGTAQETVGKDHASKVTGNRQIDIAGNRGLTVQGGRHRDCAGRGNHHGQGQGHHRERAGNFVACTCYQNSRHPHHRGLQRRSWQLNTLRRLYGTPRRRSRARQGRYSRGRFPARAHASGRHARQRHYRHPGWGIN